MKRLICLLAAAIICLGLCGCGDIGMEEVVDKINENYKSETSAESIVFNGQKQSTADFCTVFGVDKGDVKDVCSLQSASLGYCDSLAAVRAKNSDAAQRIKTAFEQRRQTLISQYRDYSVNGSYQRAQGALVVLRDNCVFFICVGAMPADTDAPLEFDLDIQSAMNVINELFPSK